MNKSKEALNINDIIEEITERVRSKKLKGKSKNFQDFMYYFLPFYFIVYSVSSVVIFGTTKKIDRTE